MNGTRNDFEMEVTLLLPTDPVKKNKNSEHAHISYVSTPRTAGKGKER